jgi:hypothetical protein
MLARYIKRICISVFIILLFAGISRPCGPFLPDRVLEQGDDYVLKSPEGFFYDEIEQIRQNIYSHIDQAEPAYIALFKYKAIKNLNTEDVDVNDLKEALRNQSISTSKFRDTIQEYEKARQVMTDLKSAQNEWQMNKLYRSYKFDEKKTPFPTLNPPEIPNNLPVEFEYYLHGAIYYYQNQFDKAQSVWEQLLALPAVQRKYRSVWAAFMIGKIYMDTKPKESIKWFELTRELADKGFSDNLGLASASIGWQARAELNQRNYYQAMELYIAQLNIGDKSAILSLQVVCSRLLKDSNDDMRNVALNSLSRKIVTAFIFSRGGWDFDAPSPEITRKWLAAIESAKINNAEEAGRFAWVAYSMGDTDTAARWLSKASQDDIMAKWIQAKLLLHQGNNVNAVMQLVSISRIISPDGQMNNYNMYQDYINSDEYVIKTIRGELGTLYISQKHYIEAIDSLIRGGYWEDAAYIAERILTINELKTYIDKTWPKTGNNDSTDNMPAPDRLRYLFARRLARLEKWKEARPYYPAEWQGRMDAYVRTIEDGKNQKLSKTQRAAVLWKAAVIARYEGMELMGTELDFDWFLYDGSSLWRDNIAGIREKMLSNKITPSTAEEMQRTKKTMPPDKKFHYRYIAAELAWQAAELMPDNSDQTARVLCIAGLWIKDKEPKEADKFYKALVNRNRKTELGQHADKLRWFPDIIFNGDSLLKEVNHSS